jgi:hypothetical protein
MEPKKMEPGDGQVLLEHDGVNESHVCLEIEQSSTETTSANCCSVPLDMENQKKYRALYAVESMLVTGYSIGVYNLSHTFLCGQIFRCGCTWTLAGGAVNCNIHNPTGPHCPWCVGSYVLWPKEATFTVILMVLAYLGTREYLTRRSAPEVVHKRSWMRHIAPFVMYIMHHLLVGLIYALASGYPYYLFFTFADTQVIPAHNLTL